MSTTIGLSPGRAYQVLNRLQSEPRRWQFAQAVRTVLAAGYHPHQLALLSDPEYSYSKAELTAVSYRQGYWRFSVTLPTLTGFHGVLPYGFQDTAHSLRVNEDNSALQDFYNIFSQRVLWNSYQVATRNRLICRFERSAVAPSYTLSQQLCALLGLASPQTLPAEHLAPYAGVLAHRCTSPGLLQRLLRDYFQLPVLVSTAPLHRHRLAREFRTALSVWPTATSGLGRGALLGQAAWLARDRLDIVVPVTSAEEQRRLIQDKRLLPSLREFCNLFLGRRVEFDIRLRCPEALLQQARTTRRAELQLGKNMQLPRSRSSAAGSSVQIMLDNHRSYRCHHNHSEHQEHCL